MVTDDENSFASPSENPTTFTTEVPAKRNLGGIAKGLWHQRPGPRQTATAPVVPTKAIIDGLERREIMLGAAAGAIAIVGTIAGYFHNRVSPVASTKSVATTLLVAGLIVSFLMLLGTALRRRALLGFSAFMTGMETITSGNPIGLVFLGFGGWLIFRVMKKQKIDRALGLPAVSVDTKPARRGSNGSLPKSSKRYTPPRRSTARNR